ncbi:MAG: hypothetical protein J3K34DRAFT_173722 [Monoraphidium minutum]|nr:MAG: hypothetical protein J3K34DRAFT_173722 [Monoraphidium minutum]
MRGCVDGCVHAHVRGLPFGWLGPFHCTPHPRPTAALCSPPNAQRAWSSELASTPNCSPAQCTACHAPAGTAAQRAPRVARPGVPPPAGTAEQRASPLAGTAERPALAPAVASLPGRPAPPREPQPAGSCAGPGAPPAALHPSACCLASLGLSPLARRPNGTRASFVLPLDVPCPALFVPVLVDSPAVVTNSNGSINYRADAHGPHLEIGGRLGS